MLTESLPFCWVLKQILEMASEHKRQTKFQRTTDRS